MDTNQKKLDEALEREFERIKLQSPGDEGYESTTDRASKFYKLRADEELALKEFALKEKQADSSKKQGWVKIVVDGGVAVLSVGAYVLLMMKGFKFEETGSVSSTFFRGVLQKFKFGK